MLSVIDKQPQLELRDSGLDPHNKLTGAEPEVDDDGKPKRTGSAWSASAHIITAVIGAGVLALPWGVAQLGWIAGIAVLSIFALISLYTYNLLSDCYRSPDPLTGSRNYTYMQAVKAYLGKGQRTTISGVQSPADKVWKVFSALGNIALACSYATILFDIEDTLRSHPPENKQMKRANLMGISTMAILFLICGGFGYAAFGDHTPGNMLTGFGFYDPFWLVDLGNLFIVIHLVGAYQVMAQPVYRIVETGANIKWPNSEFINREYSVRVGKVAFNLNSFRLIWRTVFVMVATILSMAMPFFNEMLALLGALGFWPLVVFFPIQMHIAQKQIRKLSFAWLGLQLLSFACFLVSITAACGAIHGLNKNLRKYKPFMYKQ
ncbi:hypothetical protein L6164_015927 [Bauhinia variegata]|uniref:Uncharacterized protein n=1 Tax=Bauhinia variegata TaxID=167791 RepID=A0ACB9NMQ1_BAUVA|nr:hypothetical protein L6164_015927 [Bauhinia variegata]